MPSPPVSESPCKPMNTPLTNLAALAIRHIAEELDATRRADILDAAASIFNIAGEQQRGEQLATTAAIIREAANAQLQLQSLFA